MTYVERQVEVPFWGMHSIFAPAWSVTRPNRNIYHPIRINAAGLDTSREALALGVIKEIGL